MKKLSQYKISFAGLAAGKHDFEFVVDNTFFAFFEYSLVKKGDLKVNVNIRKQESMLLLTFHISGIVELNCDVCLSEVNYPIKIQENLVIKFQKDPWDDEENNEILILSKQDHEFDIVELLYEYINVSIPYYVNCEMAEMGSLCDPEMTKMIRHQETDVSDEENINIDPRWAVLKNIKK